MEMDSPGKREKRRRKNQPRSTVLTHGGERVPRDGVRPSAEFSLT